MYLHKANEQFRRGIKYINMESTIKLDLFTNNDGSMNPFIAIAVSSDSEHTLDKQVRAFVGSMEPNTSLISAIVITEKGKKTYSLSPVDEINLPHVQKSVDEQIGKLIPFVAPRLSEFLELNKFNFSTQGNDTRVFDNPDLFKLGQCYEAWLNDNKLK